LKAYDGSGILLGQNTSSISARSKRVGMVEALIPGAANHSGWISVVSTGGMVGGLLVYGDKQAVPNRIAAMPAIPAPYANTELVLSSFFSDPEWWTGISLVNPSTTTGATLTLTAYAPDGTQIDQSSQSLPALNKTVGMVNTLFNLDTSTRGWVRVTSTSPIIGMEILNADDPGEQAWGLAAVEAQVPGYNLYLPHQVVSSRWWTLLSLANPNSSTATPGLTALNDDGTVLKATTKSINSRGNIADYFKHLFGL
jgi:hypothetical protein